MSINEPFFLGHFPHRPVMPGVLIIEALDQTGAVKAELKRGAIPAEERWRKLAEAAA